MPHRIPISGARLFNQTLRPELQTFRVAAGQASDTSKIIASKKLLCLAKYMQVHA